MQTLIDEVFEGLHKHIWKVLLCGFCICMLVYNVTPLQHFLCQCVKYLLLTGFCFGFCFVLYAAHDLIKPDYEYYRVCVLSAPFFAMLKVPHEIFKYCLYYYHKFVPDGTCLDSNNQVLD